MREGQCVLRERLLGGAIVYDFEGSGGERRSLYGEDDKFGDGIKGWEGNESVMG